MNIQVWFPLRLTGLISLLSKGLPRVFSSTTILDLAYFCSLFRKKRKWTHSVMSDSLRPHGLKHTSLPCSSLSPGVCSNSCPLSQWCHPATCCPLLLLPSIFPSIRVFSNESALHMRWPKYWSFSCSISPSNEYSGLISLKMDWLDLLAVQGTLKSLLQPPQVESINSSEFRLYGPTLTFEHDYWKNHSFDHMDLCQQSDSSAFLICCLGWS